MVITVLFPPKRVVFLSNKCYMNKLKKMLQVVMLVLLICPIAGINVYAAPAGGDWEASPPEWTLSGKVTGKNGEPVAGVTVLLKGTQIGTTTDDQGNYTLSVPDKNGTLVFSYVGSTPKEVPFTKAGVLNVTLQEENKAL